MFILNLKGKRLFKSDLITILQYFFFLHFLCIQDKDIPFNRGFLFNVGFMEAIKDNEFDCFVFHDVDLLPLNDQNLYQCPDQPRHMSVAIDKYKFK